MSSLKQRRNWRPGLLTLSLFLILGSMLAGILLFQSATSTTPVLVADRDLGRGEIITVDDYRIVELSLSPNVEVIRLGESGYVLGGEDEPVRSTRAFIPAGTPLAKNQFIERSKLVQEGLAVVGVRLSSGEYPSALREGDKVDLFVVDGDEDGQATYLGEAQIWGIWQFPDKEDPTNDLVADLLVNNSVQRAVLQGQSNQMLRLVLINDDENRG